MKREEVDIVHLRIKVMKVADKVHSKAIAIFFTDVSEEEKKKYEKKSLIESYYNATRKTIGIPIAFTYVLLQKIFAELRLVG